MVKRIVLIAVGAGYGVNGLVMLFAPVWWYGVTPGVDHTGPFNMHFVQDVGAAFLAAAGGLAATAWRPFLWPAAMAGAAFLALHGLLHLHGLVAGHGHGPVAFEAVAVLLPSALAVFAAWPQTPRSQ